MANKKNTLKKEISNNESKVKEVAKEITDKNEEIFYDDKDKGKVIKVVWNVVFYGILAIFAFCAIFGIINFNKVKDGNEPSGYSSTKSYVEEEKNITVYNYYVYKIVEVTDNETGKTTVSLKLWFLDDAN